MEVTGLKVVVNRPKPVLVPPPTFDLVGMSQQQLGDLHEAVAFVASIEGQNAMRALGWPTYRPSLPTILRVLVGALFDTREHKDE